ncbi:MAG TPA: family 10 glycosylhydrolase [Phycisphaerae bacterium]|nr:family 10 glycosylhydrolase [Phycisphaerales bacterium]HRX84401.1 family 10 glycosylhydrolase [Phycisphaerae bacterium]
MHDATPTPKFFASVILAAAALAAALPAERALAQTPEFRAMWVSRFEWPDANPAVCQARIDQIMADLAAANFNAVVFQVRGQADVLYPSPNEVWSPLIGGSDPGWDPLAYAINAAHAQGLEFHAYINIHTCWQSVPASAETLPNNPNHILYAHCDAADPAHRDWLHHNTPDNPVQFSESSYVWFAPGVPAFQAYVRAQVLYVVSNYAVDGVHYDRIRTPWSNQPSYDPISLARFNDAQSNPAGLDFTHWTADQIDRTVRDMYAAIMAVNPNVKVSAAVYNNIATAPTAQHQDAATWAQTGGLDIIIPMLYFAGGAGSTWDNRLQAWIGASGGRHVVAGHITSQGISSLLEQIALARTRGAQGNNVFSYSSFGWWSDYTSGVYATPVAVPAMPWKTSPATGIIQGYVTDAGGAPVTDVQITRNGTSYVALSSGDGYYSFLLVPPGVYTLTAAKPGYPGAVVGSISVGAGDVIRRDLSIGAAMPPIINEVTPDPETIQAGNAYSRQLTLAQGAADHWVLLAGPQDAVVNDFGLVSGWVPSTADAGQTFMFLVRAINAAGSDDESWQVHVEPRPPCSVATLADFEGYANGTRVLFQLPRYSGSTSTDLLASPNVAAVTDAVPGFSGDGSLEVSWEFVDDSPERWLRLTTNQVAIGGDPTIELDRPIRVRLRLDSGRLRVCAGVRETGTSADIGDPGGTSGAIEWIGADGTVSGAPQGVLVEPMPGVWQTFIFDPLTDPITAMNGDGVIYTPTGKGTLEQLAFSIVDSAGPFTVHIDDVQLLCARPAFGDLDGDGDADAADWALLRACLAGPNVAVGGACSAADADSDGDVDLEDAAAFQRNCTGPY